MTNLTFSSVSSVIFTVGWLAYGMIGVKDDGQQRCKLDTHNTTAVRLEGLHGSIYRLLIGQETEIRLMIGYNEAWRRVSIWYPGHRRLETLFQIKGTNLEFFFS